MGQTGVLAVDLNIVAGLPYNRRIRVTGGKTMWAELDDFEVRSEIRTEPSVDSTLKGTLTQYFTKAFDGDDILVTLSLSGLDTSTLHSGYYDIVMTDAGTFDNKGLVILSGSVRVKKLVTSAASV